MLLNVAATLVSELMEKNERYGGAYRKVRQMCRDKYGDPFIPFAVHSFEKELRLSAAGDRKDTEDPMFDLLGYAVLEYICYKLDDPETTRCGEVE